MKFLFIPTVVLISFALLVQAEPKADSKSEVEAEVSSKRTCRIVFPERPNSAPKTAYLYDGKENYRVNFPSMNFSEVVVLNEGELTLIATPTKINDPKHLPAEAPKLSIPKEVKDFYILLQSDPTNPTLPVQMRLVDATDKELGPGQTLWVNLTNHRISAKLGEQEMTMRPVSETITKDPTAESGYYRAEFNYQSDAKGEFYKITEQHWWHDSSSKHLGFIVDSGGKLPKIFFYRDFRLPEGK